MRIYTASLDSKVDKQRGAMPKHGLALLLPCFFVAFAGLASATTIDFTFKAITAEVSFNGAPAVKVDLSVDLLANTANLVTGGGYGGSDRYLNLKGFFSSKALGLSNVESTTPLAVHLGAPSAGAPFTNSTALLVSGDVVNGIFNMPAIETWNRVSSIGPLLGSATASGPLSVVLKNGDTLSITTFESAKPYGNASFQTHIVADRSSPDTSAPSVDGSLRKLSEKDLYLQTKGKILRFRLLAKTQFRDQQGASIRDSLLHSGDQLSVIVNPDDPETAVGVVLVRKRDRRGT
jgi:hypothetical protein